MNCRGKVQGMLDSLCKGISDAELLPAFRGLLQAEPHVRAAAVNALAHVPLLVNREHSFTPRLQKDLQFLFLSSCQA